MAENKQQQQIREITDQLEQGIQELFESQKYMDYLRTMSKFHNYSLNNTLLIAMQKPDATLVAGYNAWQKQFGRQVQKGEKAIRILAPAPYKKQIEMEKIDPNTQRPVLDANGKPETETVEVTRPAFKIASVFDVSQTDGKELPSLGVDELSGDVEEYTLFFEALKRSCPVPIGFEQIDSGAKGYYHQVDKRIAIQEGMSEVQTVKTAIHEMAHQKLHDRDQEKSDLEPTATNRNSKEVEAESVAFTICQHYGIDTSDYSFSYIAGWSAGKETPELKASLNTIRTAANEMITEIDSHVAEINLERISQEASSEITLEEKAMQLATQIDEFAHDTDLYEYRDTVQDRDSFITGIRDDLLGANEQAVSMRQWFQDLVDEGEPEGEDAKDIIAQMDEFIEMKKVVVEPVEPTIPDPPPSISFFVAECMEFQNYGEFHEGLTMKEALDIYERIPSDRLHAGKGIGFDLHDGSDYDGKFDLMERGKVQEDLIKSIDHYRNSPLVQQAIADCKVEMYLRQDEITVVSAVKSNYEGMIACMSADNKIFLGKAENYDNRGHFDNTDRSMVFVSDQPKVYSLLYGTGFVKTKQECLDNHIFSADTFAEYDRIKTGVLSQFHPIREQFFGEPIRDASLKIGFDHYLELHIAEDRSWDYTLYDKDFLEIDGGQMGDENMSYDTAVEEILTAHGLKNKTIQNVDADELDSKVHFAEAMKNHEEGFAYQDYVLRTEASIVVEETMEAAGTSPFDFDEKQMEVIYDAAKKNMLRDDMLNPLFSVEQMKFVVDMTEEGYDVSNIYVAGKTVSLTAHAMDADEIAGMIRQIEYDNIPKMLYNAEQWKEIQDGMKKKLNVKIYANPAFHAEQMREIRRGLDKKIDVAPFADPAFSDQQMRFLRRSIESGYDVSEIAKPEISANAMKRAYFAFKDGAKVQETNIQNTSVDVPPVKAGIYSSYATKLKKEPVGAAEQQQSSPSLSHETKATEKKSGKKPSVLADLRQKQAKIAGAKKPGATKSHTKEVME